MNLSIRSLNSPESIEIEICELSFNENILSIYTDKAEVVLSLMQEFSTATWGKLKIEKNVERYCIDINIDDIFLYIIRKLIGESTKCVQSIRHSRSI